MHTLRKTDEQLIDRALNGSKASWVKLVKRYENLVYNYCLRMTRNSSDAMDLMQEVFMAVYRNLPSYHGQNQFKAWLMRISANKTIDYLRHKERNPQNYGEDFHEEDFSHSINNSAQGIYSEPAQNFAKLDNQKQVKALMQSLPLEQRMVVELKFFQQYTFEVIWAAT